METSCGFMKFGTKNKTMGREQKSRDIRRPLEAFRPKDYKMKLLLAKK